MDVDSIQTQVNNVLAQQKPSQFGQARYAFFFKPGLYNNLNVEIGYYTTVHGLGYSPDDVTIKGGGAQSSGVPPDGLALNNFWRGVENLAVFPTNDNQPQTPKNLNINLWAVSQATYMRRVHVKGVLFFSDFHYDWTQKNYSSGGFIADSLIDTSTISRTQQQWMSRNTDVAEWPEGVWNMVFVGCASTPSGAWPQRPYTVVNTTPVIREKPYLVIDGDGKYSVQVPHLKSNSNGPSWSGSNEAVTSLPINRFYIAKSNSDNASTLNAALHKGCHLILTPGVYTLDQTIRVNNPNTVVLGLGMATLIPTTSVSIMKVADVPGVSISGIVFDAGPVTSPVLFKVGPPGSSRRQNISASAALQSLSHHFNRPRFGFIQHKSQAMRRLSFSMLAIVHKMSLEVWFVECRWRNEQRLPVSPHPLASWQSVSGLRTVCPWQDTPPSPYGQVCRFPASVKCHNAHLCFFWEPCPSPTSPRPVSSRSVLVL